MLRAARAKYMASFGLLISLTLAPGCADRGADLGRTVVSLNGVWEVEQGSLLAEPPATFSHTAPVPALLTVASPPFADIGLDSDLRSAFWYRTTFATDAAHDVASLVFHKAKYGLAIWLDGVRVGEDHFSAFTAATFDVSGLVEPGVTHTLVARVGAWRDAVPAQVPIGQDAEKLRWIPGLYDDVELVLSGTPHVSNTQVVVEDLASAKVVVKTWLTNAHGRKVAAQVRTRIYEWPDGGVASDERVDQVDIGRADAGQAATVRLDQRLRIHAPRRWSPEQPSLYLARTEVFEGGALLDTYETRFGLRTTEWLADGPDGSGFYLNGERYALRGTNLTVHRFFEDDAAGTLPWQESWIRELLGGLPKELHWNTMRLAVGRAPRLWYRIADEVGLLLADEFMMWTFIDSSAETWTVEALAAEYRSWMAESWNHPSIAWWDGANETADVRVNAAIDLVRALDPTRGWESGGFNPPNAPGDPIEDHPYLFFAGAPAASPTVMDTNDGQPPQGGVPTISTLTFDDPSHPYVLNEYGWLWVNRDGTPTELAAGVWGALLGAGPHAPAIYREAYAYLVAGLTGFWRSHGGYRGVLHFTHLGYSRAGGATSDNWVDIDALTLEPRWREYAKAAFAPVAVYIDTWDTSWAPGAEVALPIRLVNDQPEPVSASLIVRTTGLTGVVLYESEPATVMVEPWGVAEVEIPLQVPSPAGGDPSETSWVVDAVLTPEGGLPASWSRRKVGFDNLGIEGPPLP